MDGLGKELFLQQETSPGTAAADVHSSSECPELSVEEMTASITDTSSSVNPHHLPSMASNNQSTSLDITTSSMTNSTAAANSCEYGSAEIFIGGCKGANFSPLKMVLSRPQS